MFVRELVKLAEECGQQTGDEDHSELQTTPSSEGIDCAGLIGCVGN